MARNDDEPWRPAVEAGDVELLRQVIQQHGMEVLKVPWNCTTPLHVAVRRNHVAMVYFLVEECSSVACLKWSDCSMEGKQHDALQIAADSKNLALVQYLVEKGFDLEDKHLSAAVASGDQAIANFMMEARLLHEVKRNNRDMVKTVEHLSRKCQQLLEECQELAAHVGGAGAELEQFRQVPLFTACQTGPLTMVQYLVESRRISVESRDVLGQTPLFNACWSGQLEIVRYLVEKCHASVECFDDAKHRTPLSLACRRGHVEIVEYLVEKCHAKLDVRRCGSLYDAMSNGHLGVVRYLVEKCGVDCNSTFYSACDSKKLDMVRYFLQHGNVNVNWTNTDGETALHVAVRRANWNMAQLLVVDGKANVSATCNNGWNALHLVCLFGRHYYATESVKIVQCLLRTGRLNVNAQDCHGKTALHYYCTKDDTSHIQIPRLLLECGQARVDLIDADGKTCLHLVTGRSYNSLRLCYLLVHHLSADFGTKGSSSKRRRTQSEQGISA